MHKKQCWLDEELVSVDDSESTNTNGAPQGPVLAPILFSLFSIAFYFNEAFTDVQYSPEIMLNHAKIE